MGFYRIIKKTLKFVLYQMPKKWLIMIIFALVMTFGLTQVKASDVEQPNGYIRYNYNGINREVYFYSESNLGALIMCNSEGKPIYLYYRFIDPKYNNGSITFSNGCYRMNYTPSTVVEGRFVPDYSYTRVDTAPIPSRWFYIVF